MHMPPAHLNATFPATSVGRESDSDSFGSDLSDEDWDDLVSEDNSESDSDGDALVSMTPAEQAEKERFGAEYIGPKLSEADSAKLLTLMAHASTCPCEYVYSPAVRVFVFRKTSNLTISSSTATRVASTEKCAEVRNG